MKLTWYIVFFISIAFLQSYTNSTDPKSINLAIQASVLVAPEDFKQNTSVVNTLRRFLDQLGYAFVPIAAVQRRNEWNEPFTNFITKLCNTVLKYDENELKTLKKSILVVANSLDKNNITKIVKKNMRLLGETKLSILKNVLKRYIKNKDGAHEHVGRFEKFYNYNDLNNLENVINNFDKHNEIVYFDKIIMDALNLVIFNKYRDLKGESKMKFIEELRKFERQIKIVMREEKVDKSAEKSSNNDIVISKDIIIDVNGGQDSIDELSGNDTNLIREKEKKTSLEDSI